MKTLNKKLPLVVIFGRTNVGKSTLFNCLTEKKQAIISSIAGTTRDANLGTVEWQRAKFDLVDTGGIIDLKRLIKPTKKNSGDLIQAKIEEQAKAYLDTADVVLFVVDAKTGLMPEDRELVILLKKILQADFNKVILVVNKVDNRRLFERTADFHKLGMGEVYTTSAATGSGTGDLLDIIVTRINALPPKPEEEVDERTEIKVILIGKPNVGKSSLLNSLLGEERVIVSPIAHTTREPQDIVVEYKKYKIRLIDTAGMSRQGVKKQKKVTTMQLEKRGIEKSLESLERADIALFVFDVSEPLTHQDSKNISEILDRQKSLIIIANKWDLMEEKDTKKWTLEINRTFPFALWAPILFISAKTKSKVDKVLDLIIKVAEARKVEVPPSVLNNFLMKIVKQHLPAKASGVKHPHIHRFEMRRSNPPLFEVRIGSKDTLHFSYVRFIANRLRDKFGYLGTPVRIWVSKNKKVHGQQNEGRGYVPLDMQLEDEPTEKPDEELNF
jgi:GTP-binding protein